MTTNIKELSMEKLWKAIKYIIKYGNKLIELKRTQNN